MLEHLKPALFWLWLLALLSISPQNFAVIKNDSLSEPVCRISDSTDSTTQLSYLVPACPPECTTLEMPSQTRCVTSFWNCNDPINEDWRHMRKRWKWKCEDQTNDYGCCLGADPGPSCAGNSGLLPCTGIPPQT